MHVLGVLPDGINHDRPTDDVTPASTVLVYTVALSMSSASVASPSSSRVDVASENRTTTPITSTSTEENSTGSFFSNKLLRLALLTTGSNRRPSARTEDEPAPISASSRRTFASPSCDDNDRMSSLPEMTHRTSPSSAAVITAVSSTGVVSVGTVSGHEKLKEKEHTQLACDNNYPGKIIW